jgi:hypothetical protein
VILTKIKRDAVLMLAVDSEFRSIDVIGVADGIKGISGVPDRNHSGLVSRMFAPRMTRCLTNFCWIRPCKFTTREVHDFLIPTQALDDCIDDCPRCKHGLTCQAGQIVFAHICHGVLGKTTKGMELDIHLSDPPIMDIRRKDRRGLASLGMRADEQLAIGLRRILTGEIIHFTRVLKPEENDNGSNSRD